MRATRLWVLACLSMLGSGALASCGEDEAPAFSPVGGNGGVSAGAKATPEGGESAGGAGAIGPITTGGSGGVGAAPGVGGVGEGGTPVIVAGAGAGAGAGGAPVVPDGEQLTLCDRLTMPNPKAFYAARAFSVAALADCRVKWLVPLGPDREEYRQQVVIWSLRFWGCQGEPVNDFGLVYDTPALSVGDVNILIEHYLASTNATNAELALSPAEQDEMKAALERLAQPLITSASTEPSQSVCAIGGAGGAGGVGGVGGSP